MAVLLGGLSGTIGFLPMVLEEDLVIVSKRHDINLKDTIDILNALVDAKISDKDLQIAPTKSGFAYQNKLDKKTLEIWKKAEPKFKGTLKGNMYYSALREIIMKDLLRKYRPFRKYQK